MRIDRALEMRAPFNAYFEFLPSGIGRADTRETLAAFASGAGTVKNDT